MPLVCAAPARRVRSEPARLRAARALRSPPPAPASTLPGYGGVGGGGRGSRVLILRAARPNIHSVPLRVHAPRRARTQSPPPPVTGGDSGSGGRPLTVAVCPAAFSHDDCRQQPQPSTASPADSAMTAFSAEYGSAFRSFRRHHGHLTHRPRPPPPRPGPGSARDGRVRPAADGRAGPFRFRKDCGVPSQPHWEAAHQSCSLTVTRTDSVKETHNQVWSKDSDD